MSHNFVSSYRLAPKLTAVSKSQTVDYGKSVTFMVEFKAHPLQTVMWLLIKPSNEVFTLPGTSVN